MTMQATGWSSVFMLVKMLVDYTLPNLSPLELEFQVKYQTKVGIPS